jgi:Uma2 family endonuclease
MAAVAIQRVPVEAPAAGVQPRRWTREEYHRLAELGILGPEERVELIDGEIVVVPPQGSPHYTAIRATEEALRAAFGPGYDVRVQGPLALEERSEPEPDVAVVRGTFRDYEREHPASAVLVVEVADTTARYDRERKGRLYARAGIPEYWLLNLPRRRLEVYREPVPAGDLPRGARYATRQVLAEHEVVTPLAAPQARIAVADLLPRRVRQARRQAQPHHRAASER